MAGLVDVPDRMSSAIASADGRRVTLSGPLKNVDDSPTGYVARRYG